MPTPAPGPGPVAAPTPAPTPGPVAAPMPAPPPGPVAAPMPAPGVAPLQPLVPPPTSTTPTSPLGHGVTFEANMGFGRLRVVTDINETATYSALSLVNLGIGGWISARAALTLRFVSVIHSDNTESDIQVSNTFFGLSVQYWITHKLWLSAGAGRGRGARSLSAGADPDPESGLGLDFRAGASKVFGASRQSMNVSLEVIPTFLDHETVTGIALLLGYQFL
jgi:hypothetical protein